MHKYQPRIHIIKLDSYDKEKSIITHMFEETKFIAVTAYQNEEVSVITMFFFH